MAETVDIGRLFFHTMKLRGAPFFRREQTVEISPPYRASNSVVIRPPLLSTCLVIGWWRQTGWDEEKALQEALGGGGAFDPYDDFDTDLSSPEVRRQVRANIADSGLPLEEEWQILSALGLDGDDS